MTAHTRRVFRAHDEVLLDASAAPILHQLAADWCQLVHSTPARDQVASWAADYPQLGSHGRVDALVDHIDQLDDEATDQALGALLGLSQAGDQLAMRVLLQLMLPGLAALPRRCRMDAQTRTENDRWQATLAAFCSTIPTVRTRRKVAASLLLGTVRELTAPAHDAQEIPAEDMQTFDSAVEDPTPAVARDVDESQDLVDVLAWAVRTEALTLEEARLLAAAYAGDRDSARADGRNAAERQRRSRASRKLIDAVHQYLEHDRIDRLTA